MRILYVSQYFPPEMGAPAARVSDLAGHWTAMGHDVTVLTGFPNHPTGVIDPTYRARFRRGIFRERMSGASVVRTWLVPLPNGKPWERIVNYCSFCLSACVTGTFLAKPDVVIATCPQLLVGLAGWWLARIKRVPFVLEIRDLWPDAIIASGVGTDDSALARALRFLSALLYRVCDHVVVVTPAFATELVDAWSVPAPKITVIANGVEADMFTPDGDASEITKTLGLEGRFVVSYVGTLGLAHGLGTVLDAAALAQEAMPDACFVLVGEGAEKRRLVELARRRGLDNVIFAGQQPREAIPSFIRASDVCLVTLKRAHVFETVIPTKMLEFMSCGRPVVLAVDGQARALLEDAGAGLFAPPEDARALVDALRRLHDDADLCGQLGRNGRRYVEDHLSRAETARAYAALLEDVAGSKS